MNFINVQVKEVEPERVKVERQAKWHLDPS